MQILFHFSLTSLSRLYAGNVLEYALPAEWVDHLLSASKAVFIYVFLIIIMRIMGKRELGQISVFDIVVLFIISELLSLAINNPRSNLLNAIIPIMVIVGLEIATSYLVLKREKARKLIEGTNTYLIFQGRINQAAMRQQRFNLDDLMTELRASDVSHPKEVQFAILESRGRLNVVTYAQSKVLFPDPLISDGVINDAGLKQLGKDRSWLEKKLSQEGYPEPAQIFLCLLEPGGLYVLPLDKH